LALLKLAGLVLGVLALAKLSFLDFITGGFDTGGLEGSHSSQKKKKFFSLVKKCQIETEN
jgi:hypothetical protein